MTSTPNPLSIVSLLPSATEIVCALGAASELTGISHECDYPPEIRGRNVLTRSRIETHRSSREIDSAVRAVVTDALSVYAIDEQQLAAAAPDVVITQNLCEVCAVSLEDVKSAFARSSRREQVKLVSLSPTRLADVLADVEKVALAIGRSVAGRALRNELETRIARIEARARGARRPRVATVEWLDPLMLGGTWMPELVTLAGGTPLGPEPGAPAETLAHGALGRFEPEVIVLKPCGFSLDRTLSELPLIEREVLAQLKPGARVFVSDGNAFFNRPGPRLVESLEILAACLHPERFPDFLEQHHEAIYPL